MFEYIVFIRVQKFDISSKTRKFDINTEHNIKSICRPALLIENTPDSELYLAQVQVHWEAAIFYFYIYTLQ